MIFWRDSAGWCPFCEMTWLLLESMGVPYRVRTVPLRRYMLDGESKDPEYVAMVGPDGVVPGMQFGTEAGGFGTAIQGVERIFGELCERYPERYPSGDTIVRARACEGEDSVFGRLRIARRAYEACAGAQSSDTLLLGPLAAALADLDALLATTERATGGPFLGGHTAAVADLMLLPLLERTAAVVPFFFGADAFSRARVPFDRTRHYIERARESFKPYAELSSDPHTLARTNLRYAEAGTVPRYSVPPLMMVEENASTATSRHESSLAMRVDEEAAAEIDGTCPRVCLQWALTASIGARREAAARLAASPSSVAAFARRCHEHPIVAGSLEGSESAADGGATSGGYAVDSSLRAVASLLLLRGDGERGEQSCGEALLHEDARALAGALAEIHSAAELADAAAVLRALALNIGVPRDMGVASACALRSHARIVAKELLTLSLLT